MDLIAPFMDKVLQPRDEENFIDRLNFRYTTWLLLAGALFVMAPGFLMGAPIQCWTPAEFPGGWSEYAHDYCFVENTYWIPFEKRLPTEHADRDKQMLNYYQWVPFVLALQALFFNIPHLLWRVLNYLSGLHVRAIIGMSASNDKLGKRVDDTTLDIVASHINEGLEIASSVSRNSNPVAWIFRQLFISSHTYVTVLYILLKVFNVCNLVGQFFLLSAFIGPSYDFWGAGLLWDLGNGNDWFQTGHFPRVTMCDFEVRSLGNIHRYSVQCVLNSNMLNEKIYLFLWWWMTLVLFVTIADLIYWAVTMLVPETRLMHVEKLLRARMFELQGTDYKVDSYTLKQFAHSYLHADGVVLIRLIQSNVGDLVASDVVKRLWIMFKRRNDEQLSREMPTLSSKWTPSPPTYDPAVDNLA